MKTKEKSLLKILVGNSLLKILVGKEEKDRESEGAGEGDNPYIIISNFYLNKKHLTKINGTTTY